MIVLIILANSNDHTVRYEELLGKSNYSEFWLFISITHGIIWNQREIYRSSTDKAMQVLKQFFQANTLLRALWKPTGK